MKRKDTASSYKLINNLRNLIPVKDTWLFKFKPAYNANKRNLHGEMALVHPCIIDGKQTLVYPRDLPLADPQSFRIIQQYARVHDFNLKQDQRKNFLEGVKRVKNKKLANVVSVLTLSAGLGLMSNTVAAAPKSNTDVAHQDFSTHESVVINDDADFYLPQTDKELAQTMLDWLQKNTTFDLQNLKAPDIATLSSRNIARMAFGGNIPKAVDPEKLKIYGLYNFHHKTVYLLDSIDLNTTSGKGILLHELVHYIQYETGMDKDAACMHELEALAYRLEARFLDEHQHRHGITQKHISKVSQCSS